MGILHGSSCFWSNITQYLKYMFYLTIAEHKIEIAYIFTIPSTSVYIHMYMLIVCPWLFILDFAGG